LFQMLPYEVTTGPEIQVKPCSIWVIRWTHCLGLRAFPISQEKSSGYLWNQRTLLRKQP
jgi:hypothetical protein